MRLTRYVLRYVSLKKCDIKCVTLKTYHVKRIT